MNRPRAHATERHLQALRKMHTTTVPGRFFRDLLRPIHHHRGPINPAARASLSAQVLLAQEAERRRVSREMHDDLAQRLALLQFEIEGMKQRFASDTRILPELDSLRGSVAVLAEDLHRMCERLHPAVLDNLGLIRGIESLCEDHARLTGVRPEFVHRSIPPRLPANVSLCLYRVVQEALQNIGKHARAAAVFVTVCRKGDGIRAAVRDKGPGFARKPAGRTGLGLTFISERVNLLEGRCTISSAPGKGTRISVWVPCLGSGK